MRIIAGREKGRKIDAPAGRSTRPTADRVRESIMSSVMSACSGFEGLNVADIFAGSGALGLECISRGAKHAFLADVDPRAVHVVEDNAKKLGYGEDAVSIMRMDVISDGIPCFDPYDVVFCDPPYDLEPQELFAMIARERERGTFSDRCLVVYESSRKLDDEVLASFGLGRRSHKKYGKTFVDFLFFP